MRFLLRSEGQICFYESKLVIPSRRREISCREQLGLHTSETYVRLRVPIESYKSETRKTSWKKYRQEV